jgi:hypothetical protein
MADLPAVKRKRHHYYIAGVSWLPGKAVRIGEAPLSEEKRAAHRPDLPFAIARSATTSWTDPVVPDEQATAVLTVSALYMCAFGPKGGMKAPIKLIADDGHTFTVGEVLCKAAAVQDPHLGNFLPGDGIGNYRLGLQRGLACYYLWGATPQYESET